MLNTRLLCNVFILAKLFKPGRRISSEENAIANVQLWTITLSYDEHVRCLYYIKHSYSNYGASMNINFQLYLLSCPNIHMYMYSCIRTQSNSKFTRTQLIVSTGTTSWYMYMGTSLLADHHMCQVGQDFNQKGHPVGVNEDITTYIRYGHTVGSLWILVVWSWYDKLDSFVAWSNHKKHATLGDQLGTTRRKALDFLLCFKVYSMQRASRKFYVLSYSLSRVLYCAYISMGMACASHKTIPSLTFYISLRSKEISI